MDKRNAIKMAISLKNRHRSENRFKIASYLAILFSISFFILIYKKDLSNAIGSKSNTESVLIMLPTSPIK